MAIRRPAAAAAAVVAVVADIDDCAGIAGRRDCAHEFRDRKGGPGEMTNWFCMTSIAGVIAWR